MKPSTMAMIPSRMPPITVIEAMTATMPSTRAVIPIPLRGCAGGAYSADPAGPRL